MIEQNHRFTKKINKPMMGFKAFHSAKATLRLYHLIHFFIATEKGERMNRITKQLMVAIVVFLFLIIGIVGTWYAIHSATTPITPPVPTTCTPNTAHWNTASTPTGVFCNGLIPAGTVGQVYTVIANPAIVVSEGDGGTGSMGMICKTFNNGQTVWTWDGLPTISCQ